MCVYCVFTVGMEATLYIIAEPDNGGVSMSAEYVNTGVADGSERVNHSSAGETCWEAKNSDAGECATDNITHWTVTVIGPSGTVGVKSEQRKESARKVCPMGREPVYESAYWERLVKSVLGVGQPGERGGRMAPYLGVAGKEPWGEGSKMAGASTGAADGDGFSVRLTGLPGRILTVTGSAAATPRKSDCAAMMRWNTWD